MYFKTTIRTLKLCIFILIFSTPIHLLALEPDPWWDARYSYRKRITVTNNSSDNIVQNYSLAASVDHASLVSSGSSLSSGNDVRIVYWNGSNFTELDRISESGWNTSSANIWFPNQLEINGSGTDVHYYMYYGNSSSTSPPENRSQIYLWYDDFSTDTLSNYVNGRHVDFTDKKVETFTYDSSNERVNFSYVDKFNSGLRISSISAANLLISCDTNITNGDAGDGTFALGLRWTASFSAFYGYMRNAINNSTPGIFDSVAELKNNDGNVATPGTDTTMPYGTTYKLTYAIYNSTHRLWFNNSVNTPATQLLSGTSSAYSIGNPFVQSGEQNGYMDNLLVRHYIETEPSTSLGSEENLNDYKIVVSHPYTAGVSQGENNIIILRLDIASSVNETLTEMSITGNNTANSDVDGASAYYTGASMVMETSAPFGSTSQSMSSGNTTFNDSRILPDYNLLHMFITYDISNSASTNNIVDAYRSFHKICNTTTKKNAFYK